MIRFQGSFLLAFVHFDRRQVKIRMKQLSFLGKMTIFGLLLSTIPVIFIGIFSYITSSNEIQDHVNRGKLQLLMQTNANVEQILTTVNHTLNQVINSVVLKEAMNQELTVDHFMLYNDLRQDLRNMQSFDTKLEDVVVVNLANNWLVKNSGLYRLDEYPYGEQLAALIDYPHDNTWILNPNEWFYTEESASSIGCPYTISMIKKLPVNSLTKTGLVLANLPACSLQEIQNYEAESNSELLILDEEFRILMHPDKEKIGDPISTLGYLSADQLTGSSGQYTVEHEGEKLSVIYHRSDFNGWIYVSKIDVANLTKESNKIGLYTLAVCLILLLLSMITVLLGSRHMYSPIRGLMRLFGDSVPDLSQRSINEFQVIGEQVASLFQSKSRLENEVRHHLSQVRTFFLVRLCQGNVRSHELIDKLIQYGYEEQVRGWKTLAVMTLQIDKLEHTRYTEQDMDLLHFAIQNMIEELIPAVNRLTPVILDQTIVTIAGHADDDREAFNTWLYGVTENVQKQIFKFLDLQVSIGISQPFADWAHIPRAYREGLDALRLRIKLGEGIIIQYEDMSPGQHYLNLNYPQHLELELIDAIKLADHEQATELLSQFLSAVLEAELTPQEYQISLARLLNSLLVVMQEAGISLNQIQHTNSSLFEQLTRLQTASDIAHWFRTTIIGPMINIFRDRQDAQYHNISEKMIDMIQKYYDTDLTLEQCASELHYNANYLSSVFRKETNYSFSEYLAAYRFSMAKKWLAESDMTIKDIATKLRYNNPQNFIRSFRKHEGMTPGQYREKHMKHVVLNRPH